IDIAKDWHLYANPVGNEDLADNKTEVIVSSKGKPLQAKVQYPEGILVKDKVLGDYRTYEGRVAIQAAIQRPEGNDPLEVTVKLTACDKSKCLPPAQVKVTVP